MALFRKKPPSRPRQPRIEDDSSGYTFRRSRTLSGSASPNVKTTKRHADMQQSSRLQSHALRRRRRKMIAILALLIVLIFGTYWLMTQYAANTSTISYSPAPQVSPNNMRYKTIINKYLRAHPLERFRFALNDGRLSQYVSQQLPEVVNITSTGGGIGYGDYEINLRKPIVDWKLGGREYLVDSNGVAFSKNYYQKPTISVIDKSDLAISGSKDAVASNSFLAFLGRLVARVDNTAQLGPVQSLTIPADATREVDVTLKGESYFFKLNINRDDAAQVQDMQRVSNYFKQHKINPQYVDLRVAGRAFYR